MGERDRSRRRRHIGAWTLAAAGAVAIASCSYASVRTTGDVALTLPEHIGVLEDAAAYCRLSASTSGDAALAACQGFARTQPIYARGARELTSYGLALKELSGVSQIPTADLVSALVAVGNAADVSSLEGEDGQALAQALRIVVDVFANGYKKRNLRRAVVETDRAVQCVVHRQLINTAAVKQQIDGLEQDLMGELEDLEILAEKFDAPPAPGEAASEPEPEDGVAHEVARAQRSATRARRDVVRARRTIARDGLLEVSRARRRVEALERGLAGFAAAHHTLACAPDIIGTLRDDALANDVLAAVRCATTSQDAEACRATWAGLQRARSCVAVDQPKPRCRRRGVTPGAS